MPTVNVNGYDLFYAEDDFAEPWRPHDAILMQHYVLGNHAEYRPCPTGHSLARAVRGA